MSRRFHFVGALSIAALVLASCGGGGDSSGRTKNSALCYATQEEKDAAVQAARDAFDAAMTGVPTEDAPEESPTSVEEETPSTISQDTTTTIALEEAGGGYRRPAVRIGSGGDTSTTVEEQTDSDEGDGETQDGSLTPEQQQAQMDLEAAEAQPLCETETSDSSVIECTGTVTVEGASSDCGPVVLYVADDGAWHLDDEAQDPALVLAEGTVDISALSAENPITFPISYEAALSEVQEDVSDQECLVRVTRWGFDWRCSEPINVVITTDLYSSHANVAECLSEGTLLVPEDYRFYFAMYQNAETPFFSGYNDEQEQDVEFSVGIPDSENSCSNNEFDSTNWDSLPFSGQSDVQIKDYAFTVPDDLEGPVFVKFESATSFDVDIDEESDFEESPCDSEEGCENFIGYSVWDLAPGEYVIEIEDNQNIVSWTSNVEILAVPVTLPELPFSYSTDGSKTKFVFSLEETQGVIFWATAGQTCTSNEDNDEENGFADPELEIFGVGVSFDDDNSGRGMGNCSASLLDIELEAGTYMVTVEDDDSEGFPVTLNSSVELQQAEIEWKLSEESVFGEKAIEFVVPDGGAWFRAEAFTNQLETYTYENRNEGQDPIDMGGCANPDADMTTPDNNCVETSIGISNGEFEIFEEGNAEYRDWSEINGFWVSSWINSFGTTIEEFLPAGTYTLFALGRIQGDQDGNFTFRYGFGSLVASELIEIEAKEVDVPPLPVNQTSVALPVNAIAEGARVSTAISSMVEEFVCDAECIDAMFLQAGIADGTISVSAGGDSVTLQKGQKKVVIPVGKNAGEITAVAISADGSTTVRLGSEITTLPEGIQSALDTKTVIGNQASSGSSKLLYLIGIIVVLVAAGVVIRRKQATQNV